MHVESKSMNTIDHPHNLPWEYQPFLLGNRFCKKDIDMDAILNQPLIPLKNDYIFDAGEWVLKLPRTDDPLITSRTHLSRVLNAKKFHDYILENNLTTELVVPETYLYWHASKRKFYVVSEKIDLSEDVATPANLEAEKNFKLSGATLAGQMKALADGKPQRSLTVMQAKALAGLACLGYEDLDYNNLYFALDGRVAIIDTKSQECVAPYLWGNLVQASFYQAASDASLLQTIAIGVVGTISILSLFPEDASPLAGIAKLKLYCDNKDALKEVEIIGKKILRSTVIKTIVKIALSALMIYAASYTSLLPLKETVSKAIKEAIQAFCSINLVFLTLSLGEIWIRNYQGPAVKI